MSGGEKVNENGYPADKRTFNRAEGEFKNANHGAAIAFVGRPEESHASIIVGSCATVVAPVAGAIRVGINDNDVTNNRGTLSFEVTAGLPTIDQWQSGGIFHVPRHRRRSRRLAQHLTRSFQRLWIARPSAKASLRSKQP